MLLEFIMKIRFRKILRRENLRYSACRIFLTLLLSCLITTFIACFQQVTTLIVKKGKIGKPRTSNRCTDLNLFTRNQFLKLKIRSLKDVNHSITSIYY